MTSGVEVLALGCHPSVYGKNSQRHQPMSGTADLGVIEQQSSKCLSSRIFAYLSEVPSGYSTTRPHRWQVWVFIHELSKRSLIRSFDTSARDELWADCWTGSEGSMAGTRTKIYGHYIVLWPDWPHFPCHRDMPFHFRPCRSPRVVGGIVYILGDFFLASSEPITGSQSADRGRFGSDKHNEMKDEVRQAEAIYCLIWAMWPRLLMLATTPAIFLSLQSLPSESLHPLFLTNIGHFATDVNNIRTDKICQQPDFANCLSNPVRACGTRGLFYNF